MEKDFKIGKLGLNQGKSPLNKEHALCLPSGF